MSNTTTRPLAEMAGCELAAGAGDTPSASTDTRCTAPVDGTVKQVWYHAGRFLNAALDKASVDNERNALWFRTGGGTDVTCVQVAGLIARRILCYVSAGAELQRGERFGFIRFGSRVDHYLPLDAEVKAALGDKVKAAETVLAWLKSPTTSQKS